MPDTGRSRSADTGALKRLRWIGRIEGVTLLTLLFVAVPLKYLGDWPIATAVMGPVHGVSFIVYLVTLVETASAGDLNRRETVRAFIACIIPFGPFFNDGLLKQKINDLESMNDLRSR